MLKRAAPCLPQISSNKREPSCSAAWRRVGEDVATLAPHRPGRADFPHPVPHEERFTAATGYLWMIIARGSGWRAGQRWAREERVEARPREPLGPCAPFQPFPPQLDDLLTISAHLPNVPRATIVGHMTDE